MIMTSRRALALAGTPPIGFRERTSFLTGLLGACQVAGQEARQAKESTAVRLQKGRTSASPPLLKNPAR